MIKKFFIRNIYYYLTKYCYLQFKDNNKENNLLLFIFEENRNYPGLVDRIKSLIGAYYIAKENGRDFKIKFNKSFDLGVYLIPNSHDWNIDIKNITNSFLNTRLIDYNGIGNVPFLKKEIKQYHIYNFRGWNIFQRNNETNWEDKWSSLYNELFKPSDLFLKELEKIPYKPKEYIAIHIRFVNALGIIEKEYPTLPLENKEQDKIINNCIKLIQRIEKKENIPVLLFSDSNKFLNIAKKRGIAILEGGVGHIGYTKSEEVLLKALLDLYMIARAKKVYRVLDERLYASAFPIYGALIGGTVAQSISLSE